VTIAETSPKDLVSLEQLQAEALRRYRKSHRLARKAVAEAWGAGKILAEVRALTPHGQWRPWLKSVGISKSSADRYIRLSTLEMSHIGAFSTVTEALQALSAPKEVDAPQSVPGQPSDTDVAQEDPSEQVPEEVAVAEEAAPEPELIAEAQEAAEDSAEPASQDDSAPPTEEAPTETTDELHGQEADRMPDRVRRGVAEGLRYGGAILDELADRIEGETGSP